MGTERGGCSRLMKTPRHNGGAVHSRSKNKEKGTCSETFFKCKAYIKHGDIVLSGDERIFDYDFE